MSLQRDQSREREKPRTVLFVYQKVILKKRKSSAANFLQVLLMLQCSSSKLMTTLMVAGAGRTRKLQDLVFMVQRKDFGDGVVSGLRACVFLQMLLDLPRERTWKMGPIKRIQEFDPIFFQETFRFSQGEFTEILSSMRDMDGDLLVDANGDPRLLRRIGKTPKDYMRCWSDSALMILLCRLSRPCSWVTLQGELGGSRAALSRIFHMPESRQTESQSQISSYSSRSLRTMDGIDRRRASMQKLRYVIQTFSNFYSNFWNVEVWKLE
jgi:hypothetical protein